MAKMRKIKVYRPHIWLLVLDTALWVLSILTIVLWRYISNKQEIANYVYYFTLLYCAWVLLGYIFGKYRGLRESNYIDAVGKIFGVSLILIGVVLVQFWIYPLSQSKWVSVALIEFMAIYNIFVVLLYYGYRYALNMEEGDYHYDSRAPQGLAVEKVRINDDYRKMIEHSIVSYSDDTTLSFVKDRVDLGSSTTLVLATGTYFNIEAIQPLHYDAIVNLKLLNNVSDINKMFCTLNQRLVDNGLYLCCFVSQSITKERILKSYPKGINWLVYCCHFLFRRVCPKLFLTSHLYFDITKGKKRSLSQTEVLGRLYYCGFEVLEESRVGDVSFVLATRRFDPQLQTNRKYGPFIKLNRVGKNGKRFNVYKMRTMHPYSEYLQAYMYDKNQLQDGGKIKDDIRISTLGAIMRKYWIDEVPMFVNLLKGDMKLVGVRPLSQHFFGLYSKELQEKRVRFKPGMLPPFYADMPKTLEEIEDSELRYLTMCEQHGVFRTDVRYMFLILNNIIFRKARSN